MLRRTEFPSFGGVVFSPDRNGYPTASDGKRKGRGVIVDSRISFLKKKKKLIIKTRLTNEKLKIRKNILNLLK